MLDQILVNKNHIKDAAIFKVVEESVKIERFAEMTDNGIYRKPIPFGGMGKAINPLGFSDHFPLSVVINEMDG